MADQNASKQFWMEARTIAFIVLGFVTLLETFVAVGLAFYAVWLRFTSSEWMSGLAGLVGACLVGSFGFWVSIRCLLTEMRQWNLRRSDDHKTDDLLDDARVLVLVCLFGLLFATQFFAQSAGLLEADVDDTPTHPGDWEQPAFYDG